MKRFLLSATVLAMFAVSASAADSVVVAGLKGAVPAGWKEEEPSNRMRLIQYKLEKAPGDAEDAELAVFISPGGGGVEANLKRQEAKFKPADGAKPEDAVKLSTITVGPHKASYQDISGTFQQKAAPFDPNSKVVEKKNYRQLYVIFADDDMNVVSFILVGPAKTVEKHKKEFETFMASFKK